MDKPKFKQNLRALNGCSYAGKTNYETKITYVSQRYVYYVIFSSALAFSLFIRTTNNELTSEFWM